MRTFVLQVRSGREREVARQLRHMGFEAFVPMKTMLLRSGGTWFERTALIFSHYVFLRFDPTPENWHRIRMAEGFVKFLGDGKPVPISSSEEAYVRWLWNDGKPLGISKVFTTGSGDKLVLSGPLRRYQDGEIEYRLRQRRAVLWVTLGGKRRKMTLACIGV